MTGLLRPPIGQTVLVTVGRRHYEGEVTALCGDMVMVKFGPPWPVIDHTPTSWHWSFLTDLTWTTQ